MGEWQLLSDLAFADLLLWVPVAVPAAEAGSVPAFLCVAQCRPTTGPTAYQHDQVGVLQVGSRVAPLRVAYSEGRIFREVDPDWDGDLPIRREAVPVRFGDRVVAVIGRDANLASVRTPSQLELVYLQSAADLAGMIADGTFPASMSPIEEGAGPRVGDGLVRLEPDGTIIYASPNALSAFNRLGVTGNVLSEPIDALTSTVAEDPFDASDLAAAVAEAIDGGQPATHRDGQRGCHDPVPRPAAASARRDARRAAADAGRHRAASPRPADHEQGRHDPRDPPPGEEQPADRGGAAAAAGATGVGVPAARTALEESMRRVQSIALVHETLSVSVDEAVGFDEVVDRLLGMLADITGSDQRVAMTRDGSFGEVPAEIATALVLVLTEVVQNAIEHGFPDERSGTVTVAGRRAAAGRLEVRVSDDGVGIPPGVQRPGARPAGPADRADAGVGGAGRHGRVPAHRTRGRDRGDAVDAARPAADGPESGEQSAETTRAAPAERPVGQGV